MNPGSGPYLTLGPETPEQAAWRLRQQAWGRTWLCPGAGYALIGRPTLAVCSYTTYLCLTPLLAWFLANMHPVARWVFLTVLVVTIGLWLSELFCVKRLSIRQPNPTFLVEGYRRAVAILWLVGGGFVVIVCLSLGSLLMAGSGMSPTLQHGEQVFYRKKVFPEDVRRGAVIVFRLSDKSGWSPGSIVIARIIAVPGDRLAYKDGRYLVNGEVGPPVGDTNWYQLKRALSVEPAPYETVVPPGCYFVGQDNSGSYDSLVLSWAESKDILATRVWYLRGTKLLSRVR